jgi:type IV secretory pathway TraG/TraD family ATPase VirD4
MKKLFVCALIVVALIVAYNIHTRTGSPQIHPEEVFPWLADHESLSSALAMFLMPGAYALWYLGMDADTGKQLIAAALMSCWAWLTSARLIWCIVGRAVGFAGLKDFHWWLAAALPWRPPYRAWLRIMGWWRQFRYGSTATAAFTGALAAMTLVFKPGDCVFLGRLWIAGVGLYQALGIRGPRHVTVVAGAGAGKTRWLMAWLGMLHKEASAFVVDVDGQIINALGEPLERAGHKVFNLDPFKLTNFPGASINLMEEITRAVARYGRMAAVRFGQTLAEALIREDNNHQPIFANAARTFILGLILYVWLFEPAERRTLVRVRELLAKGLPEQVIDPKQDAFDVLLSFMMQAPTLIDDGCNGEITEVIARAASVMKSGKGRDGNPFRATALSQTSWLDLPEIAAISQRSDFACEDLKIGNPSVCVFICMPVVDIQTKCSGWVRALTMMTMYAFQNMPGRLAVPCAFCLDEAPSLRLEILENASAVFRKYGIRMLLITQDLEKLRQAHPEAWGGFLGNSQCTIWMGTDHQETLDYLSKELGTRTHTERIEGSNWLFRALGLSKIPARYNRVDRPLMHPHQLREFLDPERRQIIVTRTGKPPIRVAYSGYDDALPVWSYNADRNFREKLFRALTRKLLAWLFHECVRAVDRRYPTRTDLPR